MVSQVGENRGGGAKFGPKIPPDMNLQELLTPLAKFTVWTFENLLVPIADPMNAAVVLLGLGGIMYWLRLQKRMSDKARNEGKIV
jgi:hypothetical protein